MTGRPCFEAGRSTVFKFTRLWRGHDDSSGVGRIFRKIERRTGDSDESDRDREIVFAMSIFSNSFLTNNSQMLASARAGGAFFYF